MRLSDIAAAITIAVACAAAHGQPAPEIYRYYAPLYGDKLGEYARAQGFNDKEEERAVVAHELIHIAQAHHQGYYIDSVYTGPYLLDPVWKAFPLPTNRDVLASLSYDERNGFIQRLYATNTPENTLGNVIDEVNAYRLTAGWVCQKAPKDRCQKQIVSLAGQIELAAQHLRLFRKKDPDAAERFRDSPPGKLVQRILTVGTRTLLEIGGSVGKVASAELPIWDSKR